MENLRNTDPVLLTGDNDLLSSIAVCLLRAGHQLTVVTTNVDDLRRRLKQYHEVETNSRRLAIRSYFNDKEQAKLAIAITHEKVGQKKDVLHQLSAVLNEDAIIAINTQSISLNALGHDINKPSRLIGLNWTEPAHTTYFLEVISAEADTTAADKIVALAKANWSKDPYIVKNDSIHGRLLSAMAREASFLVDNGYASVEDIDRACRNDAGYYLPFCGNCRYMDLMGTYAYGMVMKDLNPDLSKDTQLPQFMQQLLKTGAEGMQNHKGFYNYTPEEADNWNAIMDKFSYQIQTIIEKYPFNYK